MIVGRPELLWLPPEYDDLLRAAQYPGRFRFSESGAEPGPRSPEAYALEDRRYGLRFQARHGWQMSRFIDYGHILLNRVVYHSPRHVVLLVGGTALGTDAAARIITEEWGLAQIPGLASLEELEMPVEVAFRVDVSIDEGMFEPLSAKNITIVDVSVGRPLPEAVHHYVFDHDSDWRGRGRMAEEKPDLPTDDSREYSGTPGEAGIPRPAQADEAAGQMYTATHYAWRAFDGETKDPTAEAKGKHFLLGGEKTIGKLVRVVRHAVEECLEGLDRGDGKKWVRELKDAIPDLKVHLGSRPTKTPRSLQSELSAWTTRERKEIGDKLREFVVKQSKNPEAPFAADGLVSALNEFVAAAFRVIPASEADQRVLRDQDMRLQAEFVKRVTDLLGETVIKDDRPALRISGPSGSGKESVARLFHDYWCYRLSLIDNDTGRKAPRASAFEAFNARAITASVSQALLEGVFPGRGVQGLHLGHFLSAAWGTILIDEVGNSEPDLQAKLLRILQEREVQPVMSPIPSFPIACCILSATDADLEEKVAKGQFSGPLYSRLNQNSARLDALAERCEEIPLLLLAELIARSSKTVDGKPNTLIYVCASPGRPFEDIASRSTDPVRDLREEDLFRTATLILCPAEIVRDNLLEYYDRPLALGTKARIRSGPATTGRTSPVEVLLYPITPLFSTRAEDERVLVPEDADARDFLVVTQLKSRTVPWTSLMLGASLAASELEKTLGAPVDWDQPQKAQLRLRITGESLSSVSDGDTVRAVVRRIADLNRRPGRGRVCIEFAGNLGPAALRARFLESRAVVVPTREHTFVVGEALTCGATVISPESFAVDPRDPQIERAMKTGALVIVGDPFDPTHWTKAILDVARRARSVRTPPDGAGDRIDPGRGPDFADFRARLHAACDGALDAVWPAQSPIAP